MKEFSKESLLISVAVAEIFLIILAFVFGFIFNVNPLSEIIITKDNTLIALAASVLMILMNFLAIFVLPKWLSFLRGLREAYDHVSKIVANADSTAMVFIPIISGFAEELFFRGVVQPITGLVIASLIFGGFHIANRKTVLYGAYAVVIGFFLGGLMIYTGSLWPPILAHMINNALAVPFMKWHNNKITAATINIPDEELLETDKPSDWPN